MRISDLKKIIKGRSVIFSIQIEYPNEYDSEKGFYDGFIIHFHRRVGWTPFGFGKTINNEYKLSKKHSFKVFQLLNDYSKFTAFHMHSNKNWIIAFIINWYVKEHV